MPMTMKKLLSIAGLGLFLLSVTPGLSCAGSAASTDNAPVETKAVHVEEEAPVTIYLVRHGEKSDDDPRDPTLSEDGVNRALQLARVLQDEDIDALFATPLKRTQDTVAPLAAAHDVAVTTIMDVEEQIQALLALPAGATAVLAGHSNTVPALIAGLGGEVSGTIAGRAGPQLADDSYDRFLVMVLSAPGTGTGPRLLRLLELRYGQP